MRLELVQKALKEKGIRIIIQKKTDAEASIFFFAEFPTMCGNLRMMDGARKQILRIPGGVRILSGIMSGKLQV